MSQAANSPQEGFASWGWSRTFCLYPARHEASPRRHQPATSRNPRIDFPRERSLLKSWRRWTVWTPWILRRRSPGCSAKDQTPGSNHRARFGTTAIPGPFWRQQRAREPGSCGAHDNRHCQGTPAGVRGRDDQRNRAAQPGPSMDAQGWRSTALAGLPLRRFEDSSVTILGVSMRSPIQLRRRGGC